MPMFVGDQVDEWVKELVSKGTEVHVAPAGTGEHAEELLVSGDTGETPLTKNS